MEIGKMPYRPMEKRMREPEFRQERARAKKLTIAPKEITTPIQDAEVLAERGERRVKLVERRIVVGQRVGFDVGDEDEKRAGEQQAGDDGAGNGDQRLLGFFAERGGAFKADAAEDGDDHTQAENAS
jgi:hypothetical protein